MAQPTYCSLGCGFVGRADTMVTHIKQRCPKRIVACPNFCGLQLGLHLVPEHVKSKCPKRKVSFFLSFNCSLSLFLSLSLSLSLSSPHTHTHTHTHTHRYDAEIHIMDVIGPEILRRYKLT